MGDPKGPDKPELLLPKGPEKPPGVPKPPPPVKELPHDSPGKLPPELSEEGSSSQDQSSIPGSASIGFVTLSLFILALSFESLLIFEDMLLILKPP
ncbi:hypothetical protein D3C71_1097560 [compost metagenome]